MEARIIPGTDIVDCVPDAIDKANKFSKGSEIDFIKSSIQRVDDLLIQANQSKDYFDFVAIFKDVSDIVKIAEDKSEVVRNMSNLDNFSSDVANSADLLDKIKTLTSIVESKVEVLKPNFDNALNEQFQFFSAEFEKLSKEIGSVSNYSDLSSVYDELENFYDKFSDVGESFIGSNKYDESLNFLNGLSDKFFQVSSNFEEKYLEEGSEKIGVFFRELDSLNNQISNLDSKSSIDTYVANLDKLYENFSLSLGQLKSTPEIQDLIQRFNEVSIASFSKIKDVIEQSEIINNLSSLRNNYDEVVKIVKEASIRNDYHVIDNILLPLVNDKEKLLSELSNISSNFSSNNLNEVTINSISQLDQSIGRLSAQANITTDISPLSLSNSIVEIKDSLIDNLSELSPINPDYIVSLSSNLVDKFDSIVNSSGFFDFFIKTQSITPEIMRGVRGCIDSSFKDFTRSSGSFIEKMFDPLLSFLTGFENVMLAMPWPLLLLIIGSLAWFGSHNIKVTAFSVISIFIVGLLNMWVPMMSTITMISVASLLCLIIGIPVGILMSRSDRMQSFMTPILDIMQTIPSFVYLIPVVMLLGIGRVPGLIAVCIYAMPPIVRLTNLGLRLVNKEAMEAADSFGATYIQRLFTVQIPLALPNIFAGINQTIMMALAMVVIASMIGVAGLGLPVLQAVQNQYLTLGLLNGIAIVILAIIFDRISQEYGKRIQKHRSGEVV